MLEFPPIMPFFYASKTTDYALIPPYYAWKIQCCLMAVRGAWFRDLTQCCGAFRTDSKEGQQLHPSTHQSGHAGWSQYHKMSSVVSP